MATTSTNPLDQFPNLPGVKVTYEDGNLLSGTVTQANTGSVLVIGTAVDGPVGQPVSVNTIGGVKVADKLFGGILDRKTKLPNGASLIRAMYELDQMGCEDIRLLRINGRYAYTELKAQDIARTFDQFLDYAAGNTAFSVDLNIPDGSQFVQVTKVEQLEGDGTTLTMNLADVMDYTDSSKNPVKVFFLANKMRPGNEVKVSYDVENRTYTLVPRSDTNGVPDYSDPDYTLTRDTTNNHYFYSSKKNWSNQLISGHIPVVTVIDNNTSQVYTVSSVLPDGTFLYRVGNGATPDPLHDPWSAADYQQGGIFFTSAYDDQVKAGAYPDITGNVTVHCEYAWYTSSMASESATQTIPGTASTYTLDRTPLSDDFNVYYLDGNNNKVLLQAGKDYGFSALDRTVTVNAGAAPVGVRLYASYKTMQQTADSPKLMVKGKYPGSVYGRLVDPYDQKSITGVQIEVQVDTDPRNVTGNDKVIIITKPDEKRTSYKDIQIIYRTLDMPNIRTLREFVNYVNNDARNNVVTLECPNEFGDIPVQGLLPTNGPIFLGQESPGVMHEDPSYGPTDPARFTWLGDDGLFDVTNQEDMQRLYEILGGKYEVDENGDATLVQEGIYSLLQNYVVDEILLVDAYANTLIDPADTSKNFATQLAQHCAVVTAKTWETIGVIGVAPAPNADLLSVQEYVNFLSGQVQPTQDDRDRYAQYGINLDFNNEHYLYDEGTGDIILSDSGEPLDVGRYVQVVFGPEVGLTNQYLGNYVTNGASLYAALISKLPIEQSTTNQPIDTIQGLRYDLSEAQHNLLSGARYVAFQKKQNISTNGLTSSFVVKDGVTAALATSDYNRLSTLRIVHAAVQMVRKQADPFIGLPNGLAQQNALSAEIQAGLDALKSAGVLQAFSFTIYSSVQDDVLGNAFITLELVPQFETRRINTSVVLRAA